MPKEVLDPNDPSSYHLPPELQSEEFAFRGGGGGSMRKGRAGGEEVLPPGDEETVLTEKMAGEERRRAELEGDEEERAPASRLPQMKPMPSTSGEQKNERLCTHCHVLQVLITGPRIINSTYLLTGPLPCGRTCCLIAKGFGSKAMKLIL